MYTCVYIYIYIYTYIEREMCLIDRSSTSVSAINASSVIDICFDSLNEQQYVPHRRLNIYMYMCIYTYIYIYIYIYAYTYVYEYT